MSNQNGSTKSALAEYMRKSETIERFSDVLGSAGRANRYIQSVLIACAGSNDLMACTPRSVLSAALRCASLQMSCDPAVRQGQLVPFKNYKTGQMEAALIIHYVGLLILAERTNKYRVINVREIYEGWEVLENAYTGLHAINVPGLGRLEDGYMPRWNMKDAKVIGYLGYYETHRGFKKSFYMTVEEIEEHAARFSRGYNSAKSLWKDPKHIGTMRKKTVIRAMAKWMDLGSDSDVLVQAIHDFEGSPDDYDLEAQFPPPEAEHHTEAELLEQLGFEEAGEPEETQTASTMTVETAKTVYNDKGQRYADMNIDALKTQLRYLRQSITTTTDDERRSNQQLRVDAVLLIMTDLEAQAG